MGVSNDINHRKKNKYKNQISPFNLIKSIHSFYIVKEIFLFLDKKQLLNIFIYNKEYQKK